MPYADRTTAPAANTRAEIESLLERHKARQYGTAVDYETRQARVQFRLHDRLVRFLVTLPDRGRLGTGDRYARAERQCWRALLFVLKAKLELVDSHIETFDTAFLGHIVMPNDQTVGDIVQPQITEAYHTGRMPRLLESGDTHD